MSSLWLRMGAVQALSLLCSTCYGSGGSRVAHPGICSPAQLCFNVSRSQPNIPGYAGNIQVFWATPGRAEPEIAYSLPFRGDERSFSIDLNAVRPPSEAQRYLVQDCGMSPPGCGLRQIAMAYVVLVLDVAPDGRDVRSQSLKNRLAGSAWMILGYASGDVPRAMYPKYTQGVAQGLAAYRPVKVPNSRFDGLELAHDTRVFDFRVCSQGPACDTQVPNID